MPTICSQIDNELFEALEEVRKLEERSVSNFIKVAVKERIDRIRQHFENE